MLIRPRLLLALAAVSALTTDFVMAEESVIAVEEQWELDVGAPRPGNSSPQLSCSMSPVADAGSLYTIFTINKRTVGTSQGGGLQLQLWNGETLVAVSDFPNTASLDTSGERVTWTQRMSLSKGVLMVQILSGVSQSWGKFGGKSELLVSATTTLKDLNAYDPDWTVANSGVDFGDMRVSKLVLKKIRVYTANQKSVEQAIDRVVYQY